MLAKLHPHVRRNLVGYVALFIALGGTSYAAVSLPANSVGGKQIKKDAVGASEIRRKAVRGDEVRDRSLTAAEFAPGTLLQGAPGRDGVNGATNVVKRQGSAR